MAQGHYFEVTPASPSRPGTVQLRLGGRSVELATDRGVFSPGRIDPGTAVLVDHLGPVPRGDLLDLGCGYGAISVALAERSPDSTVWAVDVNQRALALCRANAARLGLGSVRAVEPGGVPAAVRFAGIYSNPPIRIGKAPLHELLSGWLSRLRPDGAARLVVQKHLGSDSLARWLEAEGFPTRRLASVMAYRILEVRPR